jgi:hypothetical protein
VGLIIGERVFNMPPQVMPPAYKMLREEMEWAIEEASITIMINSMKSGKDDLEHRINHIGSHICSSCQGSGTVMKQTWRTKTQQPHLRKSERQIHHPRTP